MATVKMKIRTKVVGHKITSGSGEIVVETDYLNGKVYLNAPGDDYDVQTFKEFVACAEKAIGLMEKFCPKEVEN